METLKSHNRPPFCPFLLCPPSTQYVPAALFTDRPAGCYQALMQHCSCSPGAQASWGRARASYLLEAAPPVHDHITPQPVVKLK